MPRKGDNNWAEQVAKNRSKDKGSCPLEDKLGCRVTTFVLSRSSGTDNDNRLQVNLVVACSFILRKYCRTQREKYIR